MESVANPPAPSHERPELQPVERIELEVLSASDPAPSPIAVELHAYATDPEDSEANDTGTPPPWGIKLTGYHLLNMVVLIAIGLAKFILSLKGHSATPTGLEWMAGSILAAILYWIGLYEAVEPPRWIWFLHTDYAPAINYSSKYFLGGVMQALVIFWEMLPFCLFIGIPFLVLMRIPLHPAASFAQKTSTIWLSCLLCWILIIMFPEKWRIWKRMWVWRPIRRFFYEHGIDHPAPGRYRPFGKAGFILGLLSGIVLLGLGPFFLQLYFLTQKGRAAQDTSP